MPTYRYKCGSCGSKTEVVAPMNAIPTSFPCDKCGERVRRDYTSEKAYAAYHPTKGNAR